LKNPKNLQNVKFGRYTQCPVWIRFRKCEALSSYTEVVRKLRKLGSDAIPRKGWAKAFSKAKKEQMLIPEAINNSNFEWEW
jgi:hypothetical protein